MIIAISRQNYISVFEHERALEMNNCDLIKWVGKEGTLEELYLFKCLVVLAQAH